jgi:hypothetical protein
MQYGYNEWVRYRNEQAEQILERRWLWRQLTQEQRMEFFATGRAVLDNAGKQSGRAFFNVLPAMEKLGHHVHDPTLGWDPSIYNPEDPPEAYYYASLKAFAASKGITYQGPQCIAVPVTKQMKQDSSSAQQSESAK